MNFGRNGHRRRRAAAAIAAVADGCVVGSAIVKEIGAGKPVQEVLALVERLAAGAHSA
jgi:tryptophan synthase alpha chain